MSDQFSDTARCISCGAKSLDFVCRDCYAQEQQIAPLREELLHTIELRSKYNERAQKKIDDLREKIIEAGCNHSLTRPYRWLWDNGYGRQEWIEGDQCVLCLKKKSWKGSRLWH